jgi:hypothetical protein
VGITGRLPALGVLGGLIGLAQDLREDRGLAVVYVLRRGQQRQRPGRGERAQPAERRALGTAGELGQVAPAELAELGRVVPVPLAQVGRWRDVPDPVIQPGRVLAQAPRPDPVDQHPGAVRRRRLVVDAADADVWRHDRPPKAW